MLEEAPQADSAARRPTEAVSGAMRIVERLASEVGPRRPTSADERRAAILLQDLLEEEEGLDPALETFGAYSSFGVPFGLLLGAAAAPGLLPARMRRRRVGLAGLAAAALISEGSLTRTPLSDALSRRASQNVVATIEPAGQAERTVCLLAHYDTSRSGLMFDSPFVGWIGRWITLNSVLVAVAPLLEPFATSNRGAGRALALARLVLAAGLGVLAERELRGEDVPGANDNASGCAVVATLAAEIAARPLSTTRVVLCLAGCEEAGTLGARAFLAAHDTSDWLFLNVDSVGGSGTVRYLTREGVITHWDADPEMAAVAAGVGAEQPELRLEPERSPAGLTYDSSPVLAAGGRALTLSVQDGFIPNLHQPTDTLANVDPDGIRRTLAAARGIVAGIDAGEADRAPQ